MPTSTLTTIRRRAGSELEAAEFFLTLGARATGSVTIAELADSNYGSAHYQSQGAMIHCPDATTSADFIRPAGAITSAGVLSHTGTTNYSDTTITSEAAELWYWGVRALQTAQRRSEVVDALNRAMEYVYFETCFEALSHGINLDYSMVLATDTNWTDVGSPGTSAKSTTARRTPWGLRSYNLINASANEGTRSALMPVEASSFVSMWAISSVNVGTAQLVPYDVTNSVAFGDTITHSEEEPMLMRQQWVAVPSTCREVAARLLGTTASSDVFWNGLWIYKRDVLRMNLPSHVNEGFKVKAIHIGYPRTSVAGGDIFQAQGFRMEQLVEGRDYDLLPVKVDANPDAVMFTDQFQRNGGFDYPLFLQTRRPHSDEVTFGAGEGDLTNAPLHQLLPRFKLELLDAVYKGKMPEDRRQELWLKAQAQWQRANQERKSPTPGIRNTWVGLPRI